MHDLNKIYYGRAINTGINLSYSIIFLNNTADPLEMFHKYIDEWSEYYNNKWLYQVEECQWVILRDEKQVWAQISTQN